MGMFSRNYKVIILVPTLLLLFSVAILFNNYFTTGEFFTRSFELKGGTLITLELSRPIDMAVLETTLSENFPGTKVRELRGFAGHSIMVQVSEETDIDAVMSVLGGFGLDKSHATIQVIGSALGESFWYQTQLALVVAFIFMGLIVFGIFRKILPSFYVILAALSDIVVTLAFMQIFGIELSLAGLAALLMILGYSIDTDIMLTSRLLRTEEGSLNERLKSAFKTGITMTGTTVAALSALVFSAVSPVLSQIAAVLLIGLLTDICTTWMQNSVLLRWYIERGG
jgi:preprotein translocase subunit SecF